MKTYRRNIKRKRTVKYASITAAVLLIIVIVSLLLFTLNQMNHPPPTKKSPGEVFIFTPQGAEAENKTNDNKIILLRTIYFIMTPYAGDVTNVHLEPGGNTDPLNYFYTEIKNGTAIDVQIDLAEKILSIRNATTNTYPYRIRVYSDQTDDYITLQIPENSVGIN